ncbi:hypothetical protein HMPREF9371_0384 [Neisseria shayeganii 871]|uniref:Uncharacterized protein n=1 Tax=Neisseria shayeganii 871 TaxID=1032488 RepID=G4CFJ5_9NEIS|nr:hypothetical protein HMPREF9371_0384 [Neisseria shayeganii 871]
MRRPFCLPAAASTVSRDVQKRYASGFSGSLIGNIRLPEKPYTI